MCGFVGYTHSADPSPLPRMLEAVGHRGPDGTGTFHDHAVGLHVAHARLAVIDPSGGTQPITANGATIAFNGMIYNYRELARELAAKGYHFNTRTDTEVLLSAYRAWGEDCLGKLRGMFSFVIYDPAARRLFFARDPFGKKPFYYFHARKELVFASELKGVLAHPSVAATIDPASLRLYFAYGYIPAPHSLVAGVNKLPAGHAMTFYLNRGSVEIRQYWTPDLAEGKGRAVADEVELSSGLEELLSRAVKKRLIADVPVGVFLSGGVDSSAVAAFAVKHLGADKVNTFSIGFEEQSFDESAYARMVAHHLGTRHHETLFTSRQLAETAPQILSTIDEPMADPSILPTFLLCRFAKERITVALGGDGADEIFAGYGPFTAAAIAGHMERFIPGVAFRLAERAASWLPPSDRYMSLEFRLKRFLMGMSYPVAVRHHVWMAPLSPRNMAEAFGTREEWRNWYGDLYALLEVYRGAPDEISRGIYLFLKTYLQDDILTKVDRASMMAGVEVRAPFLDLDLVAYVNSLPHALKFRRMAGKYLLKKMLVPYLPPEILNRPKKGFGIPVSAWLRTNLRDLLEDALNKEWLEGLSINPATARRIADRHLNRQSDERLFLWALICLRAWQHSIAGNRL